MPRIFDLLFVLLASPVILFALIVTAGFVRLKLGAPIFYRQYRGGYKGRKFAILKFRSMTSECNSDGVLLPDSRRLTSFGKKLRSSSLDELPCIWNVLLGDMALVGPRPFMAEYLELYSPAQMLRHDVRPGITGWAQVNGRNCLSWEQKFDLDLWYVNNRSFWLDVKILFLTVKKVVVRHDVNSDDDTTMPRFTGTRTDL